MDHFEISSIGPRIHFLDSKFAQKTRGGLIFSKKWLLVAENRRFCRPPMSTNFSTRSSTDIVTKFENISFSLHINFKKGEWRYTSPAPHSASTKLLSRFSYIMTARIYLHKVKSMSALCLAIQYACSPPKNRIAITNIDLCWNPDKYPESYPERCPERYPHALWTPPIWANISSFRRH